MQSEQQDFPAQDNVLSQKQMKKEGNSVFHYCNANPTYDTVYVCNTSAGVGERVNGSWVLASKPI